LVRVHTFENTTASLEAERAALNSQLATTSKQRDDCKHQATRDASAISKLESDLASSRVAVKSGETQLATAESRCYYSSRGIHLIIFFFLEYQLMQYHV